MIVFEIYRFELITLFREVLGSLEIIMMPGRFKLLWLYKIRVT